MAKWSTLPDDLVLMINEYTSSYHNETSLRCVSNQWRSILPELPDLRRPQPPWLMFPLKNGSLCKLFDPLEKVYKIDLPKLGDKVFQGSGHGWVVAIETNGSISIVNPLSRIEFQLPPLYKFPDVTKYRPNKVGKEYRFYEEHRRKCIYYSWSSTQARDFHVRKIALSCSPSSNGFRAVAIHGKSRLAYCKVGNTKWRDMVEIDMACPCYKDLAFHDVKLYALTTEGELMVCEDTVSCPKLRKLVSLPESVGYTFANLVNSHDGLMVVIRDLENCIANIDGVSWRTCKTTGFEIFRLDMTSLSWIPVRSLGSDILFMGLGTQWCASSHDLSTGVKDQIYFLGNQLNFNHEVRTNCFDNGIFDLHDQKVKPLRYECDHKTVWPSPI